MHSDDDMVAGLRPRHLGLAGLLVAGGIALLMASADSEPPAPTNRLIDRVSAPPMPGAEARHSHRVAQVLAPRPMAETRQVAALPAPRTPVRIHACPTAWQWFGRLIKRSFEDAHPRIELVFVTKADRDCVDHLLMGNTDAALLSSGLSVNERGRGLQYRPLAHHIVAPVVHASNKVHSVSPEALRNLLNGKYGSWSDVGGDDLPVRPVCLPRHPGSADNGERLLQMSGRADQIAIRVGRSQLVMGAAADQLLTYVGSKIDALGLVPLRYADGARGVRILQVHDTAPGAEALERGVWPLGCTIGVAFHQQPSPAVQAFLDYLDAAVCQQVLRKHFVPLGGKK